MLSGEYEVEAKVRCFELGAADYITKPYNRDEILARIKTHLRLMQLTRNLEESNAMLVKKQHLLDQDLEAAGEIQKALLPQSFPSVRNVKFSFSFSPCERIGGDLFNVQILDEDHLGVYVLDVSGHGVPAAMLTALDHQSLLPQSGTIKECFQKSPYYRLVSPSAVFDLLEEDFPIERFDRYFTMAYLVLNIYNGQFSYSCAGHPPILQISTEGEITRHHHGGAMIGIGDLAGERKEGTGQLRKGDRLFFFTDGIIESEDRQGIPFGMERLEQFLCAGSTLGLDELTSEVMKSLADFSGNQPLQDDITLLAMTLWE
jgi:sigma-B regulation protein RsbU (phosphoserine phosphatase)